MYWQSQCLVSCVTVILLHKGQREWHLQSWHSVGSLFIAMCCVWEVEWRMHQTAFEVGAAVMENSGLSLTTSYTSIMCQ